MSHMQGGVERHRFKEQYTNPKTCGRAQVFQQALPASSSHVPYQFFNKASAELKKAILRWTCNDHEGQKGVGTLHLFPFELFLSNPFLQKCVSLIYSPLFLNDSFMSEVGNTIATWGKDGFP